MRWNAAPKWPARSPGLVWALAWAAAVALTLLLAACSTHQPGSRAAAAPQGRVLIIASRITPATQYLIDTLTAGGQGAPALPPLAVDVERASTAAEATAAVRRHLPDIQQGRYRAIFSTSQTFARAAQLVAPDVPVVFDGVNDPVALCLVDSLLRPGRNATGYMGYLPRDDFKMIETLHDAYPALRSIKLLVSHDNVGPTNCDPNDAYWTTPPSSDCIAGERPLDAYVQRRVRGAELAAYAHTLGLTLRFVVVCDRQGFGALAGDAQGDPAGPAGWLVSWQSLFDMHREALVQALNASAEPAIYHHHGYTRAGGLMSLQTLLDDVPDRASHLALLRVLGGAAPATLPVQIPRGFSLLINAATAERLPLHPSLLALRRADRIVQ